jgi:HK97 family phage portal protein
MGVNINFWEAFFGVNFNDTGRYYDKIKRILPEVQVWGQKSAVWVDTNEAYKLFIEIPELRAVIDKRASMQASAVPILYDKNGKEITNHWLNDLIKKPNPLQSWGDFIYSLSVQDSLYSQVFIYSPKRSFDIRNLALALPASKIEINLTGKKLKQIEEGGLIENYKFKYDSGDVETIKVEDVIYITTNDGLNLVNPTSRIASLVYPLSNIKASYNKRNVLLENIGAIGILSASGGSDIGGALPLLPEEKEKIRKDWYARSKDEIIITESAVNWQAMSYPTKDLMLFEELTADKLAIIDAFGLNANLFSSEKGSTFSNVRDSIKMVYQDTIQPETQAIYDTIMNKLGLDKDYKLVADFSHLPILQPDEESTANVYRLRAEALTKMSEAGIELSDEEKRSFLGI